MTGVWIIKLPERRFSLRQSGFLDELALLLILGKPVSGKGIIFDEISVMKFLFLKGVLITFAFSN